MSKQNYFDQDKSSFFRVEVIAIVAMQLIKWLISLAIILEFSNVFDVVSLLESGEGTICHHQTSRCLSDSSGTWAVCARCSGMYFGWILLISLSPLLKFKERTSRCLKVMLGLFLVAVVAALLERFGIFSSTNIMRAILGMPLGIFPAIIIIYVIARLKEALHYSFL